MNDVAVVEETDGLYELGGAVIAGKLHLGALSYAGLDGDDERVAGTAGADQMRDVQPGEIVYLSIVRNGQRVQVHVHVQ